MMLNRSIRLLAVSFCAIGALVLALWRTGSAADSPPVKKPVESPKFTSEQVAFFEKQVLPILKENCLKCHGGGEKIRGGLKLTSREQVLAGGDTGSAVSLTKPDDSLLLKAIHYKDEVLRMPPTGKLPQDRIDILTKWVKDGLPWNATGAVAVKPEHSGGKVTPESKNYWAYKPVKRLDPPKVKNSAWVRNPIDAFILEKLEAKGLAPNAPADKIALIRRVTYDLTGLPPTPEQVDAFVTDPSPEAYEKLIDALLATPQYGERWGRHWLDLVRYAETNGYERDGPKPYAWRFRDYVIKSFNDDKPYDLFIKEQLAGDELPWSADAIIATGYYRLGLWDDEPVDPVQSRFDGLDDIVATTGQVFLGMTMNCARCHDHKIDPIPQADYYRLLAFFTDVQHYSDTRDVKSSFNLSDITPKERRSTYEEELKQREKRLAELTRQMTVLEEVAIKKMPAEDQRASEGADRPNIVRKVPKYLDGKQKEEYEKLRREVADLKRRPAVAQELALSVNNCNVKPPQTHILIRGNAHNQGAKVEPGFPEVLGVPDPKLPAPGPGAKSTGRRTVLADWLGSKDNKLTARVFVNRLWQHHFGRGIVPSTNDFGKFGMPPTHPELLDWLASEFMAGDWKIKRMHKLIMMSNTYQMSSRANEEGLNADPANNLFWRFGMRRLSAEEVRDSVLAVSGTLRLKAGGPSIYPKIPREVLAGQSVPGQGWGNSPPDEANRRSVYVHIKRSLLVPVLTQHDQADTDSSCPVRYTTTVPTQALGMLNGEFANEQAAAFAERLKREAPESAEKQVRRAIRLTTGRMASHDEVKKDAAFVRALGLERYCLLALNANEFVYID